MQQRLLLLLLCFSKFHGWQWVMHPGAGQNGTYEQDLGLQCLHGRTTFNYLLHLGGRGGQHPEERFATKQRNDTRIAQGLLMASNVA